MENLSFNAFNEGTTLIESLENFRQRFGFYPKELFDDKIYQNRDNIRFCKKNGIRFFEHPLGRPSKDEELKRKQLRQDRKDIGIRNAVEGKFGEGKRLLPSNYW